MENNLLYKEVWEVIKFLDKCSDPVVLSSFSIENLRGINTIVKGYSETYAEQIEQAFTTEHIQEWLGLSR